MELFASVLLAVQVLTSLSIIVLVLLQQGKGADMGSSFGGGSAGSLFGASGAANFLSRTTKWVAVLFFASTIGLAWISHHPTGSILDGGIMQGFERDQPAAPAGSEIPGASGVPVPDAVPQGAAPSVPQAPSQAGNESAQIPEVPAVTGHDSVPTPDIPAAAPDGHATETPGASSADPAANTVENN